MESELLQRSMTTKQTAEYLGMSEVTLKRWRGIGEGPDYFKLGRRKIRYDQEVVDKWLTSREE